MGSQKRSLRVYNKESSHWPRRSYSSLSIPLHFPIELSTTWELEVSTILTMRRWRLDGLHVEWQWQPIGQNPQLPHEGHPWLLRVWPLVSWVPSQWIFKCSWVVTHNPFRSNSHSINSPLLHLIITTSHLLMLSRAWQFVELSIVWVVAKEFVILPSINFPIVANFSSPCTIVLLTPGVEHPFLKWECSP